MKAKMLLHSEAILNYLLNIDEEVDTLITCRNDTDLEATDQELYEAIGSLQDDEFNYRRLVKFLEVVRITPTEKRILTHERVDELRKTVLQRKQNKTKDT